MFDVGTELTSQAGGWDEDDEAKKG